MNRQEVDPSKRRIARNSCLAGVPENYLHASIVILRLESGDGQPDALQPGVCGVPDPLARVARAEYSGRAGGTASPGVFQLDMTAAGRQNQRGGRG